MTYMSWNSFVIKHQARVGFLSAVSASLPKGPHFDKNNKKLPTPYGLFKEWATKSLNADWASTKVPGGFIICVSSKDDAICITKNFGLTGEKRSTPACDRTEVLKYSDSNYTGLAKQLGYNI